MKNYKQLLSELPSKSVVFTVGRFNPPTLGHELSVKVVRKLAKQRKADHIIFVLNVQDAKKNPLEISKKLQYLELIFPNTRFVQIKDEEDLCKYVAKYKNAVMVTSSERAEYFKKKFKHNKLETFEVIPAGHKCPDSDDRILKVATKGNYLSFRSLLPTTVRELDGKRLMNDIRIGLDLEPIKEQINLVKDELREQYFRGEIFNEGDIVESDNQVYKIIKRGSNHLLLQTEEGLKVSKWVQDVQLTEREFMANIKEAVGTDSKVKFDLSAQREVKTAEMQAKHAKQKEDLQNRQKQEFDSMKKNMQTQQNEAVDSPEVDTKSKYNIAKSIMSLADYRKTNKLADETPEETKIADTVKDGLIGNSHLHTDQSMRHRKVKYHLGEGYGRKDAYTRDYEHSTAGMGKRQSAAYHADGGANDEGHEPEKFKPRSTMDRPHTVHIGGKPWKKFSNGHQAHAAARTLQSKGKDAVAIAHFKEETEDQSDTRKAQLKRFRDQAAESKLCEVEKLDELSKDTLKAYVKANKEDSVQRASSDSFKSGKAGDAYNKADETHKDKKREQGLDRALNKLSEEEFSDINEEELMALVEADLESLPEDAFYEAYDDEELAIIDDETGEEIESVSEEAEFDSPMIMEVLSRIERIRAKARMRRTEAKRKRAEMIAVRRLSTPQVANKRARRMAISAMKKRLLKGRNPQKISIGEKERVERFIAQRKKIVDRLAARMVSRVKQVEKARMSHKKFTKPNNGVAF